MRRCCSRRASRGIGRRRPFTREQAAVLRVQTSNEADALARRPAAPGFEQRARALSRRAARLAALLQRLHDHPADRAGRGRAGARVQGVREVRVSKVLGLALGILAAIGGFVDIGDLVFNVAAGATFGYQLLWVIPIGVVGIIVYSEMCGRVAAVSRQGGLRRGAGAGRLQGRPRRARGVRGREPDDAGRRARRRRDRLAAPLGPSVPLADRPRRRRSRRS